MYIGTYQVIIPFANYQYNINIFVLSSIMLLLLLHYTYYILAYK